MKNARFIFLVVMLFSVQMLLISNAMYIAEVKEAGIREQVNYLQFTLLVYAAAVIFFILSLFVTAPKLRKVNSMKAYVIGTVTAMVIITLIFLGLFMLQHAVFNTDSSTGVDSNDFFIGSILALFPAIVLRTGLIRISLRRSKK
ncbi:hypothetical protein [Bacillus sp. EB01]|uniref:hypothetical protein n=1 Tax=Bacillus sp. EB01 TaxID=1347086 RepID=UPI0012DF58CA|nr:hypothetical protein [Bacillus sp. EB01]